MVKWHHLPEDPMGGSTGEAYFGTLNNNSYSSEERLARESLQNSRDAVSKDGKLKVEYKFAKFTGQKKKSFVEALNLSSLTDRKQLMGLKGDNCLDHLGNGGTPIHVLYISDYNTHGLYGSLQDRAGHFRRFLFTLGDRTKSREGSTVSGGSYGFGKAVYALSSKVHIIVAYSRFDEKPDSGISARLMGAGFHKPYDQGRHQYNGRSIFGQPGQGTDGKKLYDAISGDQAHELAEQLGFKKRNQEESGTSILILDPLVKPADLVRGIETWWWPASLGNTMDVTVVDEDNVTQVPKPSSRPDLRPFIDTFNIANGVSEPLGKHQDVSDWSRLGGCEIGTAAVTLLDESTQKLMPEERLNSIAMIRGPRMVAFYCPIKGAGASIAGAYVASKDVEDWLRTSEPPAHDVWAAASADLADVPAAGLAINAIHARLKSFCGAFRKGASPLPDGSRKSLRIFETMLGRLFRNRSKGKPSPPSGTAAPVHITFHGQPLPQAITGKGDVIKFATSFSLSLDNEFAESTAQIKVRLNCSIVEDEGIHGDPLPVRAHVRGGTLKEENGSYVGQLEKNKPIRFEVESEPYDRMWSVQFVPEVEVAVEGEDK